MRRGEVCDARLDPTEGSERAGYRPVIIVTRDAINAALPIVIVVPCTTYRLERRVYPSQVVLHAPEGGLSSNSVALCEQVRAISKRRLVRSRGVLSPGTLNQIDRGLLIALDLLS